MPLNSSVLPWVDGIGDVDVADAAAREPVDHLAGASRTQSR